VGRGEDPLLEVEHVAKHFGGVRALTDVSLTVERGRIHCLIGPNGAGKTTLFEVLSGTPRATAGAIRFAGRDITRSSPDRIARMGLVRTFQSPRAIGTLTVRENLMLGVAGRDAGYSSLRLLRRRDAGSREADGVMRTVGLHHPDASPADLSHGARKRLELGIALACGPRLLLLDEPTAGMNVAETEEISAIIRSVADRVTVVVIEHDLDFVRRMGDRVTVLHRGEVLTAGTVAEVEADERVQDVYVGSAE
jgi:ABC-type branched-subunit amino acid transport system ATPase component